jgi:DNA repair protein RadD
VYTLRPYQQDAVQATLRYYRRHRAPGLVVLPTGAGKSVVIAELARVAKGRVLVLAHVKELVEQNHAKYESYNLQAGIYSAGLERKDNTSKVIFGSIQSVARASDDFFNHFTLVVIDECHRISSDEGTQYVEVVNKLSSYNAQICILGFTATPYRLDQGWIYQYHAQGIMRTDKERFFHTCIFEVSLGDMIKEGYLTPPVKIDSPVASYDFSSLYEKLGDAAFSADELEKILKDQRRVLPGIVKNIIEIGKNRRGIMIFTSTIRHAREVFSLLPEGKSALILGSTPLEERDQIIEDFKREEIKFLVNVSVLTTGFDAPHVDVIALLRPTESVSLFQQIIGRGLRLFEGKEDCLILDYTGVEHELMRPEIGERKPVPEASVVDVTCPSCDHVNQFWGIRGDDGEVDEHFGDFCHGAHEDESSGALLRCHYKFRSRACPICGTENDLNSRVCVSCHNTLLDNEERLRQARIEKNTHIMRPDTMTLHQTLDRQSRPRLEVRYYDFDGKHLSEVFYFGNDNDAKVFYYNFIRMHHRTPEKGVLLYSAQQAIAAKRFFRTPLYVIAEKQKQYWRVREKIFR